MKFLLYGLKIKCPSAIHRLIEVGVPATTEHVSGKIASGSTSTKHVVEAVQVRIIILYIRNFSFSHLSL